MDEEFNPPCPTCGGDTWEVECEQCGGEGETEPGELYEQDYTNVTLDWYDSVNDGLLNTWLRAAAPGTRMVPETLCALVQERHSGKSGDRLGKVLGARGQIQRVLGLDGLSRLTWLRSVPRTRVAHSVSPIRISRVGRPNPRWARTRPSVSQSSVRQSCSLGARHDPRESAAQRGHQRPPRTPNALSPRPLARRGEHGHPSRRLAALPNLRPNSWRSLQTTANRSNLARLWYDPDDTEPCSQCGGELLYVCVNTESWCREHAVPGQEAARRSVSIRPRVRA